MSIDESIVPDLIFSTISLFNVLLRFQVARQQRRNAHVGVGTRIQTERHRVGLLPRGTFRIATHTHIGWSYGDRRNPFLRQDYVRIAVLLQQKDLLIIARQIPRGDESVYFFGWNWDHGRQTSLPDVDPRIVAALLGQAVLLFVDVFFGDRWRGHSRHFVHVYRPKK